ncbi:gamma-type small acid-soluble spore protein [Halobacillus massiliensis]|uniref:gamma-type small acid-soluble spore protein n=1 Tax=Halobacillus massiliensis TaxID=1926286 RepID=UPI0009E333E1|nr:gamma-type small acid-soluble spore protein [Halobacillus massiliensis]
MAKQPKQQQGQQTQAGTDVNEVKRQNQQAQKGQNQMGNEFASEQTNAQEVRRQNQQSQARKNK